MITTCRQIYMYCDQYCVSEEADIEKQPVLVQVSHELELLSFFHHF